ncbi:uncharacterized protein LOC126556829 [Anopheles maculipalpis]|uniref:uncharacterized protein LOC126556829 n=1 Tax=Anopheles maculipalpis TaxID=1496333 RepID=UPI0021591310|nr:uncharacterized protein LOC126556829 [Anopheles maculipalpis]
MSSSAPQSHLSPTTPAGERPLSFYDNLSTSSSGGRTIQFPDIQFRFDENIPDRRSVHSTAKSDFFGLSVAPPTAGPLSLDEVPPNHNITSPTTPIRSYDHGNAGASASSPTSSGASTAPMRSPSVSPSSAAEMASEATTSTPRCSRPNSTIKTISIKLPDTSGPSEAVYMTTTVPQNFTKNASTLIGRHKPTRSSLRHSRMLVVNKSVPVLYPPGNSLNLRHLRLCRTVMILQILIGLVLNVIGLAIMVWSPSTNTKDNPYWSGMILIVCGALFLILFQFKRARNGTSKGGSQNVSRLLHQQQSPWRENCFHFLRVNALIVLLLTIFFTMLAFIYALIHATNLSAEGLRCEPQFTFNVNSSTCVCTIDTRAARATMATMMANTTNPPDDFGTNDTLPMISGFNFQNGDESRVPEGVIRLEYRDFNCNEVHGIWYYVMIVSTILNLAGCLLATTFLVIYSIECLRRSDRPTNRAKNGGESGERMADNAITATNNPLTRQQPSPTSAPDASTQPLLLAVAATQQPAHPPDTSLHSSGSKHETGGHTDTTTLSAEDNTLTTMLSDEEDRVLMS